MSVPESTGADDDISIPFRKCWSLGEAFYILEIIMPVFLNILLMNRIILVNQDIPELIIGLNFYL